MISIDLFSDPICPWCFIGKRRIEAALATRPEVSVEINWHSFQLNPMMPREGKERHEYIELKFGRPGNAKRFYDNIAAVGEQVGIAFAFSNIQRTPNTLTAHRLIRYAKTFCTTTQAQVVEHLFNGYFLDGDDISDVGTLVKIGVHADIPEDDLRDYLESDDDLDAVKSEDLQARQLGIQGVPFYILDGQYAISGAQEPEAFHPLFDMLVAQRHGEENEGLNFG